MQNRLVTLIILLGVLAASFAPTASQAQTSSGGAALAYVWKGTVTVADAEGDPLASTGPDFQYGEGARLFWSPDARTLYIARDDGLYVTGPQGAAAVQMPGYYGRTVTLSQDMRIMYYLETVSPQELGDGRVSYPLRELNITSFEGGAGRLAGYFGRYQAGSAVADINFAAALYVRDGGLLGSGRPNLWPTYGSNLFGTCCFPEPGLGMFNVGAGDFTIYDPDFIPGAAALNLTRTHLAGPTVDGAIRVIDLITGGTRDYTIELAGGLGTVERLAWSPDDTYLYILARRDPDRPLELTVEPPFPVDTRSANIYLYRLNLVTSTIKDLAWRPNVYGVSSLAATDRFVFAVVVEPNTALVGAINNGQVPPGTLPTDPVLAQYMPATHLWRVDVVSGSPVDVLDDVWGVAARPVR